MEYWQIRLSQDLRPGIRKIAANRAHLERLGFAPDEYPTDTEVARGIIEWYVRRKENQA